MTKEESHVSVFLKDQRLKLVITIVRERKAQATGHEDPECTNVMFRRMERKHLFPAFCIPRDQQRGVYDEDCQCSAPKWSCALQGKQPQL